MKTKNIYGIVGNGRLATHLAHYFTLLQIPYKNWNRKLSESVQSSLKECSTILICINDDQLEKFIQQNFEPTRKKIIHFSGALTIDGIQSTHPLMSFSKQLYDLKTYKEIPFVLENHKEPFNEIFPDLPNPSVSIDSKDKALYHALCVMGGNFTTMLWQKLFSEFEDKLNINKEKLLPYMNQIVKNLQHDFNNALTGPITRDDQHTIKKNIEALNKDPYLMVYQAFLQTRQKNEHS